AHDIARQAVAFHEPAERAAFAVEKVETVLGADPERALFVHEHRVDGVVAEGLRRARFVQVGLEGACARRETGRAPRCFRATDRPTGPRRSRSTLLRRFEGFASTSRIAPRLDRTGP